MEKIVITLYLGEKELKKLDKLRRMLQEADSELYDAQTIEDTAGTVASYKFRDSLDELLEISGKIESEEGGEDADG